jgi:hypothetical protein
VATQEHSSEVVAMRRRVVALWQQSLPFLSEALRGDTVTEALPVRPRRVLLLTERHVVYCKARSLDGSIRTYRKRWLLPLRNINNVLGALTNPTPLPVLAALLSARAVAAWHAVHGVKGIAVTSLCRLQPLVSV